MVEPTPARPRRLRRWLLRFVVGVLLLLVVAWFAPVIVAKTGLRRSVFASVASDLNGTVDADLSLGWLSPIEMANARVTDPKGETLLTAERVTSSKTLLDLLLDRSDLGTFTVEKPVVELVCSANSTNLEDSLANYLAGGETTGDRPAVAVTVTQGRVVLKEPGRDGELTIEEVEVAVTVPKSRAEAITIAGSAKQIAAEVAIGAEIAGRVKADGFLLDSVAPLVRRFGAGTELAGKLTADVSGRYSTSDGKTVAVVEGRAEVAELEVAGPWLGADRVRLAKAELPCKAALDDGELRVEKADLTCDAGTASVAGVLNLNDPADKLLARPGLRLAIDIDAAKVAAIVPRLLHIRDGMELREGRLKLTVASEPVEGGAKWVGDIQTTSLKGTHDGKPVAWDQPLTAKFAGRLRADGLPVFDVLECQSDFIGLAARGEPENFVAAANVNLDRLSARLAEFADLGGVRLAGAAELSLKSVPRMGGGFTAVASAKLTKFTFTEPDGRSLHEPELTVSVSVAGKLDPTGPVRLETGEASVVAGADTLAVALVEPVTDVRTARTGKASTKLTGDLARWRGRIGGWVGFPKHWELGGTATVTGVVTLTEAGASVERANADLTNAHFRGAGLVIDERSLKADSAIAWNRTTDAVAFTDVKLSCETTGAASRRLDLTLTKDGYALAGTAVVNANLLRVQRMLKLQTDPAGADMLNGMAQGTVTFNTANPVQFDGAFKIDRFTYGPPAKPSWSEPWVKVAAAGDYDLNTDGVRFTALKVERDGLSADAKGAIAHATSRQLLDFDGTLTYDLAKLEPQVKAYLGRGGQLAGKGSKPFKLAGSFEDGPRSAAMTVGASSKPPGALANLSGNAAVAWDSVKAYGFDVGPAELKAAIDRGTVKLDPVEATFGDGKVRVEPSLALNSKDYDLTFAKGRVVDKARLSPAACADALGFALPAIANAAQADGLLSLDLDDARVPLADPDRATVKGKLVLHHATLSPGPLATEIVTLLGVKGTTMNLVTDQVVPVRLEAGRVHHENFALVFGTTTVRSSGSVGLDGSVAVVLELPVPSRLVEKLLPNNSRLREALAKERVKVAVTGTLAKPKLDGRAFEVAAETLVRNAVKNAAKSAADDLLKKGLGELEKKLLPPMKK